MKTLFAQLLLFIALCPLAQASDLVREQRLVDEFSPALIEGDLIDLDANGHGFKAIFTHNDDQTKTHGAVILLHGRGLHADWPNIIYPLRTNLPGMGWDTLSVQMPVLHKEATFDDYVGILHEAPPRIESALRFLRQQGYSRIILLSHSCGGQMVIQWLKDEPRNENKVDALINISLGVENYYKTFSEYPPLDRINIPVLDIYGEMDIVRHMSEVRWKLISKAGNPFSHQVRISQADHNFINQGGELTRETSRWLQSLLKPASVD